MYVDGGRDQRVHSEDAVVEGSTEGTSEQV